MIDSSPITNNFCNVTNAFLANLKQMEASLPYSRNSDILNTPRGEQNLFFMDALPVQYGYH